MSDDPNPALSSGGNLDGGGDVSGASVRRPLRDGPTDGITCLAYLSPTLLASSSWDGCVRVHDTLRDELVMIRALYSPVLSLAAPILDDVSNNNVRGNVAASSRSMGSCFFAGTLDGSIYRLDVVEESDLPKGGGSPNKSKLRATLVGRHSMAPAVPPPPPEGGSSASPPVATAAVKCLAAIQTTVMVSAAAPPPPPSSVSTRIDNHNEPEEGEEDENAVPRTVLVVAAAGWDRTFTLWDGGNDDDNDDPSSTGTKNRLCQVPLPGKAFAMDACAVSASSSSSTAGATTLRCVVATAGRRICVIDAPLPTTATTAPTDDVDDNDPATSPFTLPEVAAKLVLERESSLKYQTRTVRWFPDGTGIAVSSIEGRVAIEYVTELGVTPHPDSGGGKKYAFKCHRKNEFVFPVNCVEFHRDHPCVFATGGADGTIVLWDGFAKKKLSTLGPDCDTSVAALAFHPNGTEIAIASSYTYERGLADSNSELDKGNVIYIRALQPDEFQLKK